MVKTALEKRKSGALKEKAQYGTAFGLIAVMLWMANFPVFLLFVIGILTFFIWKVFSSEGRNDTRRIFEFYLSANEILREDDRRWYGFEIQEAIATGEQVIRAMPAAPPLVHFALGALYQKLDDHSAALSHLTRVAEEGATRETAIVYPTRELREYVRMLRKIERNPAEAPMTSSAIRTLERVRRTRGSKMLDASRVELARKNAATVEVGEAPNSTAKPFDLLFDSSGGSAVRSAVAAAPQSRPARASQNQPAEEAPSLERKTISEVLHDIYDGNVQ